MAFRQSKYLNPVHPRSCPDPFALKYLNEYWCYCTGIWHDGKCFGILSSRDLVHWQEHNGAMERLNAEFTCYWAPEVVYRNGKFLMYYSVGNEIMMEIRVAVADHPAGPFVDSGHKLTREDFAIDAHVFVDDDGQRYLFYATDFLQHTHIGTGTQVDRMVNDFELEGKPQPVSRARYDWQVYDPHRIEKGGVRWHTIEGPFVLKHKNRFYQMFSGGNWKQETYGVSYAVSDRIMSGDEWEQYADGKRVLPILRTIPEKVIGPGHNSVIMGPDHLQQFCLYHCWAMDGSERVLAIDRLDWVGERMTILGPTSELQPAPNHATFTDFFDDDSTAGLGAHWKYGKGKWEVNKSTAIQLAEDLEAFAECDIETENFIAECSFRLIQNSLKEGAAGFALGSSAGDKLTLAISPKNILIQKKIARSNQLTQERISLPAGFDPFVYHLLQLKMNGAFLSLRLDDEVIEPSEKFISGNKKLSLYTNRSAAEFAGFSLTLGWEDLFLDDDLDLEGSGWECENICENWRTGDTQLWYVGTHGKPSIITKSTGTSNYELVVNVRLISEDFKPGESYGIFPALDARGEGPLITIEKGERRWELRYEKDGAGQSLQLPSEFDPTIFQQFRFRKQGATLIIQVEEKVLDEIDLSLEARQIGLFGYRTVAAFDLVRVTALDCIPPG